MKNLVGVFFLLFFVTCTVVPNFVFGESCPTVDREFLHGKSFTSIPTSGGFKVENPNDFNQMHLYFDADYLYAYVVDFNHAGNIKDILVKFEVPYSVKEGRVTFGSNSIAICGCIFGEFTPTNLQNSASACAKWNKYFRSGGNDNVFQTQFTNNCSRINFESSSLSLIMEESERYPNEFCNDFVERRGWYVSQFNQNQIFVQFSNIKTVAGYKLGSYQMSVENQMVGECEGSQALLNGEFEIFSNFSLINSNVSSCQYSNESCNMCNDDKLNTLLFGLISRNSECTQFSLSQAQNFAINGQSPKPFTPFNPKKEDLKVMIGIIVGASLGSALVLVCISILVVGFIYYYVRRKKSYDTLM